MAAPPGTDGRPGARDGVRPFGPTRPAGWIVRWGGHSQVTDSLAEAIGAFFGRLIVPVDFVPGAAERVGGTLPEVPYRAFLADAVGRRERAALRGAVQTELDGWLAAAWSRAHVDRTAAAAAPDLLVKLGI